MIKAFYCKMCGKQGGFAFLDLELLFEHLLGQNVSVWIFYSEECGKRMLRLEQLNFYAAPDAKAKIFHDIELMNLPKTDSDELVVDEEEFGRCLPVSMINDLDSVEGTLHHTVEREVCEWYLGFLEKIPYREIDELRVRRN